MLASGGDASLLMQGWPVETKLSILTLSAELCQASCKSRSKISAELC